MSAVLRTRVDIGPQQIRDVCACWMFGSFTDELIYRVTYRVDYPSVFHRGRGIDAQVVIARIDVDIDGDWKPAQLTQSQHAAIVELIEREEEVNAPMEGL